MKKLNKSVKCRDGFTMSIQASKYHYCTPRTDVGPYTHVEIGFPSEAEPLLIPYADSPENPTDTVYGYVPREVVEAVIAKHEYEYVEIKEISPRGE
jgi:hypothetical protein